MSVKVPDVICTAQSEGPQEVQRQKSQPVDKKPKCSRKLDAEGKPHAAHDLNHPKDNAQRRHQFGNEAYAPA